ncbi:MAG: DMT family transporter [Alphaproteobacteria bacterium]
MPDVHRVVYVLERQPRGTDLGVPRKKRPVAMQTPVPMKEGRPLLAAAWMAGTLVSFSLLAVATRELTVHAKLDLFQMIFLRSLIALAFLLPVIAVAKGPSFATRHPFLHFFRNTFSFIGSYAWYFGIANLPLANVFALEFTAPVWVALLAMLFLGERMTATRALAIFFGVVGTLVILRPGLAGFEWESLVVLGAALSFSCSMVATKGLTRSDSVLQVVVWMSLVQGLLAVGPAMASWQPVGAAAWAWIVLMGAASLSAHLCLTRALSLADATVVVPMDFLRVPLIAIVGFLTYGEHIDIWVLVGTLVIFLGSYNSVRREQGATRSPVGIKP